MSGDLPMKKGVGLFWPGPNIVNNPRAPFTLGVGYNDANMGQFSSPGIKVPGDEISREIIACLIRDLKAVAMPFKVGR